MASSDEVLEDIRRSTAEAYDRYVHSVGDEVILEDLRRALVDQGGQIAAALLRQRIQVRATVRDLVERVDALEQLLGLIHPNAGEPVVRVTARIPNGEVIGCWSTSESGEHVRDEVPS